jgi:DNA (cytosine-5)-methyltransferase 1
MFPEFIRAIRECQPKAFIVENVKGLIAGSFFDYFTYLIHQLRFPQVLRKRSERWIDHRSRLEKVYTSGKYDGVHYEVIWQSLNAADFGVDSGASGSLSWALGLTWELNIAVDKWGLLGPTRNFQA